MWSSFVVLQPPSDCHCSTLSSRGWWSQQTQGDHHHNCHRHHCHHHHKPLKMKTIILVSFVAHRKTRSSCRSQQYDEWHNKSGRFSRWGETTLSLWNLSLKEPTSLFWTWARMNYYMMPTCTRSAVEAPTSPSPIQPHQTLARHGFRLISREKITITSSRRPADLLAVGDDICWMLTYYSVKYFITFQL